MKTVRGKKSTPKSGSDEFQDELDEIIKNAALEGAQIIRDMIGDDKYSDASRLAAAKYAIERMDDDGKSPEADGVSITALMELIRQIRGSKELDSPKVGPSLPSGKSDTEEKEADKDWSKWIGSNLN